MKLSKREKIMLIVLATILVLGGIYYFLLMPQMEKLEHLEEERDRLIMSLQSAKSKLVKNKKADEEFELLYNKIEEKTRPFYPEILQDRIVLIINGIIAESEIASSSLVFSDIKTIPFEPDVDEPASIIPLQEIVNRYFNIADASRDTTHKNTSSKDISGKDGSAEQDNLKILPFISITLQYQGTFEQIMSFVRNIEALGRTILIKNFSISTGEEDTLTGSIQLDFYALPKIHCQDEEYLDWPFKENYGSDNPFEYYNGYTPDDGF
jgi:type IV pilus assembly protein PilO